MGSCLCPIWKRLAERYEIITPDRLLLLDLIFSQSRLLIALLFFKKITLNPWYIPLVIRLDCNSNYTTAEVIVYKGCVHCYKLSCSNITSAL